MPSDSLGVPVGLRTVPPGNGRVVGGVCSHGSSKSEPLNAMTSVSGRRGAAPKSVPLCRRATGSEVSPERSSRKALPGRRNRHRRCVAWTARSAESPGQERLPCARRAIRWNSSAALRCAFGHEPRDHLPTDLVELDLAVEGPDPVPQRLIGHHHPAPRLLVGNRWPRAVRSARTRGSHRDRRVPAGPMTCGRIRWR
jgi:hypothetical protein